MRSSLKAKWATSSLASGLLTELVLVLRGLRWKLPVSEKPSLSKGTCPPLLTSKGRATVGKVLFRHLAQRCFGPADNVLFNDLCSAGCHALEVALDEPLEHQFFSQPLSSSEVMWPIWVALSHWPACLHIGDLCIDYAVGLCPVQCRGRCRASVLGAPHELTVVTHNVIPDVISNQRQACRNSKLNFSESLQGLQTLSMVAVLAGFLLLSVVQNLSKPVLLVDSLGKSFSLLSYSTLASSALGFSRL